jgi:predicted ATP-grasp superfamily ATP-dependent carboligase
VIVTDGDKRAALAAVRAFHDAGVRVAVTVAGHTAPGAWSSACAERHLLPDPSTHADAFVDALAELVRDERYTLLVPGTDATLFLVSAARERLEPHVTLGLPPHEAVERGLDKIELLRAAAAVGIPSPPSVVCENVGDAAEAAQELGFPMILKPSSSVGRRGQSLTREHAAVVESMSALEAEGAGLVGPFIAQRFESDATVIWVGGVAVGGECITASAAVFGRSWPPRAGQASFAESLAPPPAVMARVSDLIGYLGWQGLFQLQLLTRPDGSLHAIDFNPRPWASLGLDVAAGANHPASWFSWLIDGKIVRAASVPGFHLRWEEGELRNVAWNIKSGSVGRAVEILAPTSRVVYAHLRLSDPLPFAAWALGAMRRALR